MVKYYTSDGKEAEWLIIADLNGKIAVGTASYMKNRITHAYRWYMTLVQPEIIDILLQKIMQNDKKTIKDIYNILEHGNVIYSN